MTISLCMITFNEEKNLPRCFASVLPYVDEVIVTDTGSVDDTIVVAEGFGAKVSRFDRNTNPEAFFLDDESTGIPGPYSGLWTLGDFAGARNASFAPAKSDFLLWLDADDVLEDAPVLRDVVREMDRDGLDAGWFAYESGPSRWWRERLMRRSAYSQSPWGGKVHETMMGMPPGKWRKFDKPIVRQHPPEERKQARIQHRNLKILANEVRVEGADTVGTRTLFYLGNESRYIDTTMAIDTYERYVRRAGWREERVMARFRLGAMYERKEDYEPAFRHYAAAVADDPEQPWTWFALARVGYFKSDWERCAQWTERGFALPHRENVVPHDNLDYFLTPHLYYNVALWNLGRREEAAKSCAAGLLAEPWNGILKSNMEFYSNALGIKNPIPAPSSVPVVATSVAGEAPQAPISRSRLLVKYPTRSRPDKFFSTLAQWKSKLSTKHDVRFVITVDDDDETMNREAILARIRAEGCEVTISKIRTKVGACNDGIAGREFDILILISDDMIPQIEGWDDVVVRDMSMHFPNHDGAIHYNDGFTGDKLCTLPVIGGRLYRQLGYVYNSEYVSLWCDNEYTDVTRALGKYCYKDLVLARHEHRANIGGDADALLLRNESMFATDKLTYERRKADNFGIKRPTLSILIPSLVSRASLLAELLACLNAQIDRLPDPWAVEIRVLVDSGQASVGTKRNQLLAEARGTYASFIDDDDLVANSYIEDILAAISVDMPPDCVVFNGFLFTNGGSPKPFSYSKEYLQDQNLPSSYLRIPNHICVIATRISKKVSFVEINNGEDVYWAKALLPHLATEIKINKSLYYYRWAPGSVSWIG